MRLLPATAAGILMALLLVAPAQAATTLTVSIESSYTTSDSITAKVTVATDSTTNGSLIFRRYAATNCSGSPASTTTIGGVNDGTYTGPNMQTGAHSDWGLRVTFDVSGSSTHDVTSACFSYVILQTATLGTQLSRTTFEAGNQVEPQLALQGATSDAGGQVKVTRWTGSECQGTATTAGTLPVVNAQIQGTVDLPSGTLGVRSYRAEYSGDAKNTGAASACGEYTVAARIQGTVYVDADEDGTRDPGETGLPDVKITLKRPQGTATATTNNSGAYEFLVTASGAYTLTQTQPGEYVSTTSDELTLNVATASVEDQDFGETREATLGPLPTLPQTTADPGQPDLAAPESEGGFATLRLVALGLVVVAAFTLLVLLFHRRWRKEDEWY